MLPEGGVRVKSIALSATTTTWLTCSSVTQVGTSERASLAIAPHTTRSRAFRAVVGARGARRRRCYVDEGCSRHCCSSRGRRVAAWCLGWRPPAPSLARSPSIAPLAVDRTALTAHSLARAVVRRSSAVSGRKGISGAAAGWWMLAAAYLCCPLCQLEVCRRSLRRGRRPLGRVGAAAAAAQTPRSARGPHRSAFGCDRCRVVCARARRPD